MLKKKRIDGPTVLRGADGKPVRCVYCNLKILLSPENANRVVEMLPRITRIGETVLVQRRFRHAFCVSRTENAKSKTWKTRTRKGNKYRKRE